MTDESSSPGAGWYADSTTPGQDRYWDGATWTDSFRPTDAAALGIAAKSQGRGLFGKKPQSTPEEKAAAKAAEAAEKARVEWLATPVGQASAAYDNNAGFFQVELELSQVTRKAMSSSYQGYSVKEKHGKGHADVLSQIEDVGWKLEHVGYVYVMTGQVSRDKFLSSGQEVGVMGKTVGIYLFRRNDPPPAPPQ